MADAGATPVALLPAESVNEEGVFVDDVSLASIEAAAPMSVALSYHFTDVLGQVHA